MLQMIVQGEQKNEKQNRKVIFQNNNKAFGNDDFYCFFIDS